jgi:hypothetical protein
VNADVERTLQAVERAVAGLSAEDMTWAPPGKWSAEQVLEHLDLAFAGTIVNMRRALETGTRSLPSPTWGQRLARGLILHLRYFPPGRQAPDLVVPRGGRGATVLAEMSQHLREMDETMSRCEETFGAHTPFKHPRLGPLTTRQWRIFHLVHTRHHMKQIATLRARTRA